MSGVINYILFDDRPLAADFTGDVDHGTSGDDHMFGGDYWGVELHGGLGNDTYTLDTSHSTNKVVDTGGYDNIRLYMDAGDSFTMPDGIEALSITSVSDGWVIGDYDWTDGTAHPDMAGEQGGTINGNALGNAITGSDLSDKLLGNDGNDVLSGGVGDDSLWGGNHEDRLLGGSGNDYLSGGNGQDTLEGGTGNDRLFGQAGHDLLDGGAGADTMTGGTGNDLYIVDSAGDRVVELTNEGVDTIQTSLTTFDLRGLANVENLTFIGASEGGGFVGFGNDLANRIALDGRGWVDAGRGNDVVTGGSGNDTVQGGDGNDTVTGYFGADSLRGDLGDDSLDGATGDDWIDGGEGKDRLDGGSGHDILFGQTGHDTIQGGEGNDLIYGHAGDDRLEGGAGRDTILAGEGTDQMWGNADADIFRFTRATESTTAFRDTVWDFVSAAMSPANAAERDRLDLSGIDANTTLAGNQAFTWTGNGAFFKSAGDLWISASSSGTFVRCDTNGDAIVDFEIYLVGTTGLTAADIIL
jgi:Ca2+-binding RTX toxin-like protein